MSSGSATPKTDRRVVADRTGSIGGGAVIDIHCHVSTPALDELVRPIFRPESEPFTRFLGPASSAYNDTHFAEIIPKLTRPDVRLRDMDAMGVDIQVISVAPPQYYYWTEPDLGRRIARLQNQNIAGIVADHPDRFVGLGTVPLQDMEATLEELDAISAEFGFRGIEICTNVNGTDFDDPRFVPFFQRVSDLDLVVVVHPNGFTEGQRLAAYYLINTVGMPLDSTVFLARTIFAGIYERFPELKVVVAHGGGYLPSYPARYDHAWRTRSDARNGTPHPPSTYLRRMYYDTMLFDPLDLSMLIARYGADHVLLGTDYPYDMGEGDPVGLVCAVEGLSQDQQRAILGGNAARLLRLDRDTKCTATTSAVGANQAALGSSAPFPTGTTG